MVLYPPPTSARSFNRQEHVKSPIDAKCILHLLEVAVKIGERQIIHFTFVRPRRTRLRKLTSSRRGQHAVQSVRRRVEQEISQQFWQSYFPRARYHEVKCIEACCRLLPHFPLAIGSAHDDYHFLRLNPECLGEGKCGSVLL